MRSKMSLEIDPRASDASVFVSERVGCLQVSADAEVIVCRPREVPTGFGEGQQSSNERSSTIETRHRDEAERNEWDDTRSKTEARFLKLSHEQAIQCLHRRRGLGAYRFRRCGSRRQRGVARAG